MMDIARIVVVLAAVFLTDCLTIVAHSRESIWRQDTFADFRNGSFNDSGANVYVSAQGSLQTINRWDINSDGQIDLVFANSHPIIEAIDMAIYWGNSRDFDVRRMSYLPSDGAQAVAAADFNRDGQTDLAMANYSNGTWTEMDSFIYFGKQGYSESGGRTFAKGCFPRSWRVALPTVSAQGVATADLNSDGFVDVVFAQSAGHSEYRQDRNQAYRSPSRIFWGSATGFARHQFLDLPAAGAVDVATGDLNRDGWPEIVFANKTDRENSDIDSFIYWGSSEGFSGDHRTGLPTCTVNDVCLADVNNDQWLDVIFANQTGDYSFAYLNQEGQFSVNKRLDLSTSHAKGCVVSDFNRDGFADVFFTNHQRAGNRLTNSLLYFGSAEGFSADNRQEFPTIGAWGVSAADLNQDGWVDLFVSNHREHYSYEVPSFVYWNASTGFDTSRRTPIYEHGATGNCISDFNGDRHLDILVCSFTARSRGDFDKNYVYWGDPTGQYGVQRRVELTGRESYEFAVADFDDDGQVDLALTNSGEVGRRDNEIWLYWNQDGHFDPWRVTGLSSYLSLGVQTADLDKDGYLDLVVQNFAPDPRSSQPGSYIYWGSRESFATTERTTIPYFSRAPAIADLNGDGHLDLICGQGMRRWAPDQFGAVIYWGDGSRDYGNHNRTQLKDTEGATQPEIADLNRDGYLDIVLPRNGYGVDARVLYGNRERDYNRAQRDLLSVESSPNCSIADVDNDGWLDIVFPSYKAAGPPISRSTVSRIWRGGPRGFEEQRIVWLPTNSGTGSLVSDFNHDGYPDVFMYCHRKEGSPNEVGIFGDHQTDSYLYWGAAGGFQANRRHPVPSLGVHNDSGVDIGHIVHRGFQFEFVSSMYDSEGKQPQRINWFAEEPLYTSVKFQIRVAADRRLLAEAPWYGEEGMDSYFTSPGKLGVLPAGRWLQYKAVLDTGNGAGSPILESVEVYFE